MESRIVVRGFRQVEGEDFFDTFSPTVSPIAVRTLITASTALNYKLYHIDVTGAYLSAPIDLPDILVRPPKGLESPDGAFGS